MEQRTNEWHAARVGRITASRVGAILGLSPYMTRADVMRSMVREAIGAPAEFTGNVATEYGTANEINAMHSFKLETMQDVQAVGFIAREDWAGCSPDGLIGMTGGVEIKCPYSLRATAAPVQFKPLANQPHYEAQVQFSLWVTGREWWNFYQWAPNGTALEDVLACTDWQAENLPKLRQFYAEYLHEVANNAEEYLKPKRIVIDTPESHRMMAEWDDIADQLERIAERKRELLDDIVTLAKGQDAEIAGRKVTQVQREGAVSYAKVVKDHCKGVDLETYRGKPSTFWKVS